MARGLKVLKSPWTVILIISVLLFTFWDGPVFTTTSLSQGGRLLVSYVFIPIAVAAVLLWRRDWSWASMGYYTLGLALIKMLITMSVHLWVIPRGARVDAKAVDAPRLVPAKQLYSEVPAGAFGSIRVVRDRVAEPYAVALLDIRQGKATSPVRHTVRVTADGIQPKRTRARTLDTLLIVNESAHFHTYALLDSAGQLLQVPLPPGRQIARPLLRPGSFHSRCTAEHSDETMQVLVFPHPYHAGGGPDQVAVLDSVPAGVYRLGVWSGETWSLHTVLDVRVAAGDTTAISMDPITEAET